MRIFLLLLLVFVPISLGIQKIRLPAAVSSLASNFWTKISNFWVKEEEKLLSTGSWQCGSKAFAISQKMAQLLTRTACPALYSTINSACIQHDNCYDDLTTSRAHCDQIFCHALRDMDLDEETDCLVQDTFCFMVKNFGRIAWPGGKQISDDDDTDALPMI